MCRLPVHAQAIMPEGPVADASAQVEAQVDLSILEACAEEPMASAEIAAALGHRQLSGNIRKALPRLRSAGLIEYTIPDKPNSRLQKHRITASGRSLLVRAQCEDEERA